MTGNDWLLMAWFPAMVAVLVAMVVAAKRGW